MSTEHANSYLIVFDGTDNAICSAGELMMAHGAQVQWVPDVYSAMAQLCTGQQPTRLIVDARVLDDQELAFLNLAPRFFPDVKVTVPLLDGVLNRLGGVKGRFDALSLTDLTDEAMGIRTAVAEDYADEADVVEFGGEETLDVPIGPAAADEIPEAPAAPEDHAQPVEIAIPDDPWAADAAVQAEEAEIEDALLTHGSLEDDLDPTKPNHEEYDGGEALNRLSTDGGPETPAEGPSLHDAVRQRMGGATPPPGRRLPPGAMAFPNVGPNSDPRRLGAMSDQSITPEEIEALLSTDDDTQEGGGAT